MMSFLTLTELECLNEEFLWLLEDTEYYIFTVDNTKLKRKSGWNFS